MVNQRGKDNLKSLLSRVASLLLVGGVLAVVSCEVEVKSQAKQKDLEQRVAQLEDSTYKEIVAEGSQAGKKKTEEATTSGTNSKVSIETQVMPETLAPAEVQRPSLDFLKENADRLSSQYGYSFRFANLSRLALPYLERIREEMARAKKSLSEIFNLEFRIRVKSRSVDRAKLQLAAAKRDNWSLPTEIALYLFGFKWLWGMFSSNGYGPTTFYSEEAADFSKTEATQEKEIKDLILELDGLRTYHYASLQRIREDLIKAKEFLPSYEQKLIITKIGAIVPYFLSRYQAQSSYYIALDSFYNSLTEILLREDRYTLDDNTRRRLYNLQLAIEQVKPDQPTPLAVTSLGSVGNILDLKMVDSTLLWRIKELSKLSLELAKAESEQERSSQGFAREFVSQLTSVNDLIERINKLKISEDSVKSSSDAANSDYLVALIEEKGASLSRGDRKNFVDKTKLKDLKADIDRIDSGIKIGSELFDSILTVLSQSRQMIINYKQLYNLTDQIKLIDSKIGDRILSLKLESKNSFSYLREFALFTLGLKFIWAPIYGIFYGFWKGQGLFSAFQPTRFTSEEEADFSRESKRLLEERDLLVKRSKELMVELAVRRNDFSKNLEKIFSLIRDFEAENATIDPKSDVKLFNIKGLNLRESLLRLKVRLIGAFDNLKEKQDRFNAFDSGYSERIRTGQVENNDFPVTIVDAPKVASDASIYQRVLSTTAFSSGIKIPSTTSKKGFFSQLLGSDDSDSSFLSPVTSGKPIDGIKEIFYSLDYMKDGDEFDRLLTDLGLAISDFDTAISEFNTSLNDSILAKLQERLDISISSKGMLEEKLLRITTESKFLEKGEDPKGESE